MSGCEMKTYHEKVEAARSRVSKTCAALDQLIDSLPEVIKLREQIAKRQQQVDNLLAACPHEETTVEKNYWPGGYDHQAYTVKDTVCVTCGMRVSREEIQHSWYS